MKKRTEKEVMTAVLHALFESGLRYEDLNKFMGSLTIEEAHELYLKLKYSDYCKRNRINGYKNMTDEDFEAYALEQAQLFY